VPIRVAHAEWRQGVDLVRARNSSLNFFFARHTCEGVEIIGERGRESGEDEKEDLFKATEMNEVDAARDRAMPAGRKGGREGGREGGESLSGTTQMKVRR